MAISCMNDAVLALEEVAMIIALCQDLGDLEFQVTLNGAPIDAEVCNTSLDESFDGLPVGRSIAKNRLREVLRIFDQVASRITPASLQAFSANELREIKLLKDIAEGKVNIDDVLPKGMM